jgi:hypothetical protein
LTPHMPTLPPIEPALWRRLLSHVGPDTGDEHELLPWPPAYPPQRVGRLNR